MRQTLSRSCLSAAAALALLSLAACGGGDGGGGGIPVPPVAPPAGPAPDSTPPPAPAPAPAPEAAPAPQAAKPTQPDDGSGNLVTARPTSDYGSKVENAAAFDFLNTERLRCGFGALAQDANLDTAAEGHAKYLLLNNVMSHDQDPSLPHFTGKTPRDRAAQAGYAAGATMETVSVSVGSRANDVTGRGVQFTRNLLSAPYHTAVMVASALDVGISISSSDMVGSTATHGARSAAVFDLGIAKGYVNQEPNSASVQTYPCEGTQGVNYALRGESPNPVPGRDLRTSPVGHPIYVQLRRGNILKLTEVSMVKAADGAQVSLMPPTTSETDGNRRMGLNQAFIFPDAPLEMNTQYTVTIKGHNTQSSGVDAQTGKVKDSGTNSFITSNSTGYFEKTFSFTTGSFGG